MAKKEMPSFIIEYYFIRSLGSGNGFSSGCSVKSKINDRNVAWAWRTITIPMLMGSNEVQEVAHRQMETANSNNIPISEDINVWDRRAS